MSTGTCVATVAGALLLVAPALAATPTVQVHEQRAFPSLPASAPPASLKAQAPGAAAAAPVSSSSTALMSPLVPIVASTFVFVPGADAVANQVCAPGTDGAGPLAVTLSNLLTGLTLDPQLIVVLATQPLPCGDIFYRPLANDVRGIGYQHQPQGELFDQTPDSRLDGMAFLNDFPYWQAHPAEFQNDFDHELGHRWGARVHALIDGADSTELLGRQLEHWSYFLNSGGSPLEGNIWSDLGAGQYQADTPLGPGAFSDLDLYLMGVLPPSQVRPQLLLRPGAPPAASDCLHRPLDANSPPQSCGPYQTTATALMVGIDDVIAVEGERDPPPSAGPVSVDVAVVVLGTGKQAFDLASCQVMTEAVPARIADFGIATGGRLVLNNLVTTGSECTAFTTATPPLAAPSGGGGCAVARPCRSGLALGIALGALGWCVVRRRRR
jgi:hypothetical protein